MSNPSGVATVSSSLMYNFLSATSIDASFPLGSAQDQGGSPLLFSVGGSATNSARKVLWVMLRDATASTGWRQVELSPDAGHDVQCYAILQAPSGEIFVAVAVDDGAGGSRVYVSPLLTPTADGAAWDGLNQAWVQRAGAPAGQPVQRLVAGDFYAAPGATLAPPLLLAEVLGAGGKVARYTIDASTAGAGGWSPWEAPRDVSVLHDVAVARASVMGLSLPGTWTLYDDNNGKLCLTFTSLLDQNGVVESFSVTAPAGGRALAAIPDRANMGLSHLFVGGDGLGWFSSSTLKNSRSAAQTIADAGLLSGVSAVLAAQDTQRISVWAVDASQNLYYMHNKADGSAAWPVPTQQAQHVAHLAARRNWTRNANELFYTTSDNQTVGYLWQDPSSSTWRSSNMNLPSQGDGQQIASYSTVIRFTTAEGAPLVGQPVQLSASTWVWATVNGFYMSLDGDTPVTVSTDATGTVTIVNQITDLGTPIFRVNAAFLAEEVLADPSAELRTNLAAKVEAQPDITKWTKADGTLLIPAGADPTKVQQVQDDLNQLLANMNTLPPDGSAAVSDEAPTSQSLRVRPVSFGVLSDLGDAIETAAGDVMQAIQSAAGAVYNYVIQPIVEGSKSLLQFFVSVGEQVLTFVVRTIVDALQLISWLFQQLGALIKDIIEFIGFLFEWDDIINTQRVIEAAAQDAFLWLGDELKGAAPKINSFFDGLIANWQGIVDKVMAGQDISLSTVASQSSSRTTAQQQSANAALTTSPGATFSAYQIAHGGVLQGVMNDDTHPVAEAVATFAKTAINVLSDLYSSLVNLFGNIQAMVQGGTFTLKGLVGLLGAEAVEALLEAARDLLVGLTEIMSDLATAIVDDLLNRSIQIPLLSWLFKKITQQDLTMLSALALLGAIPVTIVIKMLTGAAPFTDAQVASITSKGQSLVVLPWRARGLQLSRSARVDLSKDVREAIAAYSQVGGILSLVCSFFYPIFLAAAVDLQLNLKGRVGESLAALISTFQATLTVLSVAGSFPFDDDPEQELLDLFQWLVCAVEAVTTSISALLGWAVVGLNSATPVLPAPFQLPPIGDLVFGSASEYFQIVDALMLGVVAVSGLITGVWSYVEEMELEVKPDYHTELWDTEKLFGNLASDVGVALESLGTLSEQPEVAGAGAVFDMIGCLLNGARWADAVIEDVLYQVT